MENELIASIEKKAGKAIKNHPYPDMTYPADAVTKISRNSWRDGYLQAIEDIKNPLPDSAQAGKDWSENI